MIKKIAGIVVFLFISTHLFSQSMAVDSLKKHITYLASPQLQGRSAGSAGDSMAAVYIRDHLKPYSSKLLSQQGFQYFSLVTDVKAGTDNSFEVDKVTYIPGKDFQPFSFSANASIEYEVVFAGFGLMGQSDSLEWNDYTSEDVKGKIVLLLRGDPEPENPSSAFIPMASDRAKALLAKDKGALGVLMVSPSSIERSDTPIDIAFDKSVSDAGIPVISITRNLASKILGVPVNAIDSLEKQMITSKQSIAFKALHRVKATASIAREKAVSRNVIALIEGSNHQLRDEYIVVGAHYDHLGMGGPGSGSRVPDETAVHGGADDNASGVASLIEMARYFSQANNTPERSLLFVSFGAEEMGLVGARYFVDNLPVPLSSIKAMINLDMVGRMKPDHPTVNISGTGTFGVSDSLLNIAERNRSFTIVRIPDGYGPSDHAAFYTAGIPVLFITTGAHSDYHTPLDTPERINYVGQSELTNFTADIVTMIANLPIAPIFAEAGGKRAAGHYGRNLKVTLGIMPDVSGAETSGGMKVEGTRKDAPAARAGMLKGDIITAINGLPVSNIYDYMSRLSKLKPGETVNVEVLRESKKEVLIIQL